LLLALGATLSIACVMGVSGLAAASGWVMPPAGQLYVEGRGPFIGTLGSFCTESGCADQPWVTPNKGPTVPANAWMQFQLKDGSEIYQFSVYYADAKVRVDPETTRLGTGNAGGYKHISFTGPPAGDVGLLVNVTSGTFDAGYFYRLHVGLPETDIARSPPSAPDPVVLALPFMLAAAGMAGAVAGWNIRQAGVDRRAPDEQC
jgi:hypothetical protein